MSELENANDEQQPRRTTIKTLNLLSMSIHPYYFLLLLLLLLFIHYTSIEIAPSGTHEHARNVPSSAS
jgi:hypothetical protein|tara:strand:+ start:395 stop:598 length:204 start_codon:yes stop_codon:yes gene_type:complete